MDLVRTRIAVPGRRLDVHRLSRGLRHPHHCGDAARGILGAGRRRDGTQLRCLPDCLAVLWGLDDEPLRPREPDLALHRWWWGLGRNTQRIAQTAERDRVSGREDLLLRGKSGHDYGISERQPVRCPAEWHEP